MIDIKLLRTDAENIKEIMKNRGEAVGDIDKILELDKKRRELVFETEQLKAKQNEVSKQIPALKKEGKDVSGIFAEMKTSYDGNSQHSAPVCSHGRYR